MGPLGLAPLMKIDFALVADHALTEQSGKLSVIGIFDVLGAPQFPMLHPRLFLCIRIQCQPIEAGKPHTATIRLQDEDGTPVVPELENRFVVPKSQYKGAPLTYVQMVLGFVGLVFQKPGTYSFEIAIDNNHVHSVALHVVKATPSLAKQ